MRIFLFFLLFGIGVLFFYGGCQSEDQRDLDRVWSLAFLQKEVQNRFATGDTLILEKAHLTNLFKNTSQAGYHTHGQEAAIFLKDRAYSEGTYIYQSKQNKISLMLADYAADSSGLYHLFDHILNNRPDTIVHENRGAFAFYEGEAQSSARLEGILYGRFHVKVEAEKRIGLANLRAWVELFDWTELARSY